MPLGFRHDLTKRRSPLSENLHQKTGQGMSSAFTRVTSLAGIQGVALTFLGICFFLTVLPKYRLIIPNYPRYTDLPVDHPDLYAKHHGLLTDFNRESWTMTEEQCDAAFHPLYLSLYESQALTKSLGGHTIHRQKALEKEEANDKGLMCHKIINNTLYISQFGHFEHGSRTEAAAMLLERSITTSTEPLPDVRFCLSSEDHGTPGTFSLTKIGNEDMWLAPDFGFFSWPEPGIGSYAGYRYRARQVENKVGGWRGKKKKLFWRGATWIGEERRVLAEVADNQPWGDVHNIDWGGPKDDGIHPNFYEDMEGHCKYAFLASPEGLSYSGRLKYIQNCESVIFVRTLENRVHFTHLFDGDESSDLQNVVMLPPVDGNIAQSWRNAAKKVEELIANEERAKYIAARSVEMFRDRFVSPASVGCYWRKALRIWATVQKYNVELDGDEVPWESFASHFFRMHIPIT